MFWKCDMLYKYKVILLIIKKHLLLNHSLSSCLYAKIWSKLKTHFVGLGFIFPLLAVVHALFLYLPVIILVLPYHYPLLREL